MANHQSALKRIRGNAKKRLRNRYQLKTCKTAIKQLKSKQNGQEAVAFFQTVSSMVDKLAKKNIIHKNKAANTKAKLAKYVNGLT
jgi:small subunit ribosomal protein S20